MASKNPATRKRQRQRRKERERDARRADWKRYHSEITQRYSPCAADHFAFRSCTGKNRYTTEERAIHACIVGSAKRGVRLPGIGATSATDGTSQAAFSARASRFGVGYLWGRVSAKPAFPHSKIVRDATVAV